MPRTRCVEPAFHAAAKDTQGLLPPRDAFLVWPGEDSSPVPTPTFPFHAGFRETVCSETPVPALRNLSA